MSKRETSFTAVDYLTAQQEYSAWAAKQAESLDEYILRKRKIELNCLVNKVIENELCERDKQIVILHWYRQKSVTEIARELNTTKSAISRRIDKITDIIYDKLKYAIEYRYGSDFSAGVKTLVKGSQGLFYFYPAAEAGERIRKVRQEHCLSLSDLEDMTGLDQRLINEIERGETQATLTQLIKLAVALNISCDYIIFG